MLKKTHPQVEISTIIDCAYLFKGSNELLLSESQVVYRPHHTTGCREEEQAWIQTGLARLGNQNNLCPGRDPLLSQHLIVLI